MNTLLLADLERITQEFENILWQNSVIRGINVLFILLRRCPIKVWLKKIWRVLYTQARSSRDFKQQYSIVNVVLILHKQSDFRLMQFMHPARPASLENRAHVTEYQPIRIRIKQSSRVHSQTNQRNAKRYVPVMSRSRIAAIHILRASCCFSRIRCQCIWHSRIVRISLFSTVCVVLYIYIL